MRHHLLALFKGLLVTLSLIPLTACGSGLSLEDPAGNQPGALLPGPIGGAQKTKKPWQGAFGNGYTDGSGATGPNRRTSPATIAELMQPGPLKEISVGRANAPVTMIEYFSLTCPVCRAFHQKTWPAFKRAYVNTGKVRVIFREFPIGRSSGNASIALRCTEKNYLARLMRLLAQQGKWVSQEVRIDAIYQVAAPTGLSRKQFDRCLADEKLISSIRATKQRGRELGVIGTPTFFINGKQLRGTTTLKQLAEVIDPLLVKR